MIKNHRQFKITYAWLRKFQAQIEELNRDKDKIDPLLYTAQYNSFKSQIDAFQADLTEYTENLNTPISLPLFQRFKELPNCLIKARISLHLTQQQFANLMGVKAQQIQHWEENNYNSISIYSVMRIIDVIIIQSMAKGKEP